MSVIEENIISNNNNNNNNVIESKNDTNAMYKINDIFDSFINNLDFTITNTQKQTNTLLNNIFNEEKDNCINVEMEIIFDTALIEKNKINDWEMDAGKLYLHNY